MARAKVQQGLMPSIIDRLIDSGTTGNEWRRGYDWQQIVTSVRRDLEELLNSHPIYNEPLDDWPELSNSLVAYGLPDLVSMQALSTQQRQDIGRKIEACIARFEPRLRNVRAMMIETGKGLERQLRFHIDAQLNADPAPEIAFETIVELTTGHASIKNTAD